MHRNIRTLFLIDAIGAAISAGCLGLVLPLLQSLFKMPTPALYGLSAFAILFSIYSFSNYVRLPSDPKPFLKGIAIANLLYCFLTACAVYYFRDTLTGFDFVYFFGEVAVIVILVTTELRAVRQLRNTAFRS